MKILKKMSRFFLMLSLVLTLGLIQKPMIAHADVTKTATHTMTYYNTYDPQTGIYVSDHSTDEWSTGYEIKNNNYVRIESVTLIKDEWTGSSQTTKHVMVYKIVYTERG